MDFKAFLLSSSIFFYSNPTLTRLQGPLSAAILKMTTTKLNLMSFVMYFFFTLADINQRLADMYLMQTCSFRILSLRWFYIFIQNRDRVQTWYKKKNNIHAQSLKWNLTWLKFITFIHVKWSLCLTFLLSTFRFYVGKFSKWIGHKCDSFSCFCHIHTKILKSYCVYKNTFFFFAINNDRCHWLN